MAAIVASFSAHSVRDLASSLTFDATVFSASWQEVQRERYVLLPCVSGKRSFFHIFDQLHIKENQTEFYKERFPNECRKTKTKVITLAIRNKC